MAPLTDELARLAKVRDSIADQEEDARRHLADVDQIAKAAAKAIAGIITGATSRRDSTWSVPDAKALQPVWPSVRPSLQALEKWWSEFRARVEALPDPNLPKPPTFD